MKTCNFRIDADIYAKFKGVVALKNRKMRDELEGLMKEYIVEYKKQNEEREGKCLKRRAEKTSN